jgi:hypothetical protein
MCNLVILQPLSHPVGVLDVEGASVDNFDEEGGHVATLMSHAHVERVVVMVCVVAVLAFMTSVLLLFWANP